MKKTRLIQGTREWDDARASRIGSSEVFGIVRYYATEQELLNCGINPQDIKDEKPYITAWALYHKMLNDGIYQLPELDHSLAEYGHAMEHYGRHLLQQGRQFKLKSGTVYADDNCIASLDIEGMSESVDEVRFDFGNGTVPMARHFVCEQKTLYGFKDKLPIKHVIQAQYQITMARKAFFILQVMVLRNDTPFERGKITMLSNNLKKMIAYCEGRVTTKQFYFANNEALAVLIKTCLKRFFKDVEERKEPRPFIETDSQKNIIASVRANSFYNEKMIVECDLEPYIAAKLASEQAEEHRKKELQKLIDLAIQNNASKFRDGTITAQLDARGAFLVSRPKA
jgi:hypothetical protein